MLSLPAATGRNGSPLSWPSRFWLPVIEPVRAGGLGQGSARVTSDQSKGPMSPRALQSWAVLLTPFGSNWCELPPLMQGEKEGETSYNATIEVITS